MKGMFRWILKDESGDGLGPTHIQSAAAMFPGICSFLPPASFGATALWWLSSLHSLLPRCRSHGPPAVDKAFLALKHWLTTAPILIHPEPSCPFVVEVDASDVGVGAILSQQSGQDQKLHPCAFLSHRLNPAERNYDVGNRELLAVNMAGVVVGRGGKYIFGVDRP